MNGLTKLARRRESNRKSQQKSRDAREVLVNTLQEENERLKLQIAQSYTSPSATPPSLSIGSSSSGRYTASAATPHSLLGVNGASIDLEACRQAFLAVLASVCDPHLNTIHAVAAKFSQSRWPSATASTLHPPRPPNRPLNIEVIPRADPTYDLAFLNLDFSNLTPSSAFIPTPDVCGPLTVPGLEPPHPVFELELGADDVWSFVVGLVDMSRTDAEGLASKVAEKIRCYGFGPVLMKTDLKRICQGYPALAYPDYVWTS